MIGGTDMIVIGDVHGQYDALLELMDKLPQTKDICFVGDLIDRGPKSKEVINFVRDNNYKTVLGNHEDFIEDYPLWMYNGGGATIKSYGGLEEFLKADVVGWINTLPLFIQYKEYLISHSYAYMGDETPPEDVLWGRSFKCKCKRDIINVFGHTPHEKVRKIHNKHWCIDTGAGGNKKLSAIDIETENIYDVKVINYV